MDICPTTTRGCADPYLGMAVSDMTMIVWNEDLTNNHDRLKCSRIQVMFLCVWSKKRICNVRWLRGLVLRGDS